jgi:hypothetical protein
MVFHAAVALFAGYMIVRNGPAAYRALRRRPPGEGRGRTAGAFFPVFNVALAFAVLVVAVKALAGALISR